MRDRHERYDALAGAIALGEATADERRGFAEHARGCTICAGDGAGFDAIRAALANAREDETWRPARRDAIFEQIRVRAARRSHLTFRTFAWAIGGSLAIEFAVASGFVAHLGATFAATTTASSVVVRADPARVATRARVVAAAKTASRAAVRATAHRPPALARASSLATHARSYPQASARASVVPAPDDAALPSIDDVLAGHDIGASGRGLAARDRDPDGVQSSVSVSP